MNSDMKERTRVSPILVGAIAALIILSCGEYIIQRATSDYFQYETGNWWQLIGEADTLFVEVETPDTMRQEEVIPVSYNGIGHFVFEAEEAIYEYVSVVYNFAGSDYLVIDDFIGRIELPLVNGNTWHDSLVRSIDVSGQQITARYDLIGTITDCQYNEAYDGDVYMIEIATALLMETPDTTIIDSLNILEVYAPGIGIIRYRDDTDDYILNDYQVQ